MRRLGNFLGGVLLGAALLLIVAVVVDNRRVAKHTEQIHGLQHPSAKDYRRGIEASIRALSPRQARELLQAIEGAAKQRQRQRERRRRQAIAQRRAEGARHPRSPGARNRPLSRKRAEAPGTSPPARSAPQAPRKRPQRPKSGGGAPSAPNPPSSGPPSRPPPRPRRPVEVTAPTPTVTVCTPIIGVNCDR